MNLGFLNKRPLTIYNSPLTAFLMDGGSCAGAENSLRGAKRLGKPAVIRSLMILPHSLAVVRNDERSDSHT